MSYLGDIALIRDDDGTLDCELKPDGNRRRVLDREAVKQRCERAFNQAVNSWVSDPYHGSKLINLKNAPEEFVQAVAYTEIIRILSREPFITPNSWRVKMTADGADVTASYIDGSPVYFEITLRKEG